MQKSPKISINDQTTCIRCKRWKLFNDKACSQHPDFKTAQELYEEKIWKDINDNMSTMSFVAALRVFAFMGREDLFMRAAANLERQPASVIEAVEKEIMEKGPLTAEEMDRSLMAYVFMNKR